MMRKLGLALVLLLSVSSAASPPWLGIAGATIMAATMLLALIYVIGYGFGISELQFLAKEELYQLIVLVGLIGLLAASDNILNSLSTTTELKGASATMQDAAVASITASLKNITDGTNRLAAADMTISVEASRTMQCSVLGLGYSLSGCGGYAMLATPFSVVGSILGFAAGELYAVLRLIQISQAYSMVLLLPLGMILRTFRLTRGAGGLLMAVAVSTYLLLPLGIVFVDKFGEAFQEHAMSSQGTASEKAYFAPGDLSIRECNPGQALPSIVSGITSGGIEALGGSDSNDDKAMEAYLKLRISIKGFMFLALVKATLGPVISVLMMISGIRMLTALGGAEIDVSTLSRLV